MPAPIIVVLPELDARQRALGTLRAAGHEVVAFADPIDALKTVENDGRARVLVVAIDFGPGTLNGLALALMLRYRRPTIKAVFVGSAEDGHHAAAEGVFLRRPLNPTALLDAVERQFTSTPEPLNRCPSATSQSGLALL